MPSVVNKILKQKWIDPKAFVDLCNASTRRVIPLDSTWYMPNVPRDPQKEFLEERIPGARFFDIDGIKDDTSPYPHMLPSRKEFYKGLGQLGLQKDDVLVVYDKTGIFSAPRAVWMLKSFGHANTLLLNSFPAYKALGLPLESGEQQYEQTLYAESSGESIPPDVSSLVTFEELKGIVNSKSTARHYIVDARPEGRFTGAYPEPRPGLSSGHVPGAISLPFSELIEDGKFKDPADIGKIFKSRGVGDDKPVILMCGTGVTACVLENGLQAASITSQPIRVYDGSWTEWAQRAEDLIVKD